MISTEGLATWLRDRGLPAEVAISVDGEIPPMPDRLVALTASPGQGTRRERSFDVAAVQVICRGAQRTPADAEGLAQEVDDLLMGAEGPQEIGGRHVISIDQQGGGPGFLDRDDSMRVLTVCTYLFEAARSVF